jgi:hypothetical protein
MRDQCFGWRERLVVEYRVEPQIPGNRKGKTNIGIYRVAERVDDNLRTIAEVPDREKES